MKGIFLVLAIVVTASLRAQGPDPMPLAHGNVPGEPHHHLKLENEYVRVYYVEVPPHDMTQLHQHDHDYLFVTLGDAEVINAVRDKPEMHLVLKDGETHFTRGGFAHVARNLADTPFRNVTIELLNPQTNPRNQCEQVALDLPTNDCNQPDDFKVMLRPLAMFATKQILVSEVSISMQNSYTDGQAMAGGLIVAESGSRLDLKIASEPAKPLYGGEVAWLDGQKKWKVTTPGRTTARFLLIQFKTRPG